MSGSVDVVVPMRNGAATILRTLESVLAQTWKPSQIIIVDGGSTDGSANLIPSIPEIKLIVTPTAGVSHARNLGIQASSAQYVAFLDCDDLWSPDKLRRQMEIFESRPAVSVVYTGYDHADIYGNPIKGSQFKPALRGAIFSKLIEQGFNGGVWSSTMAARRDAILRSGGYDETLNFGENLDLWLRLASQNLFDFCPEVLVHVVENPRSGTRNARNNRNSAELLAQHLSIMEKWVGAVGLPPHFYQICCREILITALYDRMGFRDLRAFRKRLEVCAPKIAARVAPNTMVFFASIMLSGVFCAWAIAARMKRYFQLRKSRSITPNYDVEPGCLAQLK